jgi:CRISPR-associated protein (Cas_Csd1)
MSQAFFEDPYELSASELTAPSDFDERLRPLLRLYEIGKQRTQDGMLPYHAPVTRNSIGIVIDSNGRAIRMATPSELPQFVPMSGRSSDVLPHLGADDLGKLLASSYRPAWLKELAQIDDDAANALAVFIGSLPVYDKLDSAQKRKKEKPDPDLVAATVKALSLIGLTVEENVFSTELFPTVIVFDASGSAMSDLPLWSKRHIDNQRSILASPNNGLCSLTGMIGPLARLTGSIQGVSVLTGKGKSAVISVNQKTFAGLYRDGLRDAALSVSAAELMTVGLDTLLSESSVSMRIGSRSAMKRKASFVQGIGKAKKTIAVSILLIEESHGDNAGQNLLTALARTIREEVVPERTGDDGSKIGRSYRGPDLDRLEFVSDTTVLLAIFSGSSAGVSFDAWDEMTGVTAAQRITAWSKAQRAATGEKFGFDIHSLSELFAIGGGGSFLRSITHGESIPGWVARSAIDQQLKYLSTGKFSDGKSQKNPLLESAKYLSTLGLFLLGTDLSKQEHIMTLLRDTPAFRLGAWLGAIQTAWEKGVGEGKQDRGPVSGIRSLASKPGARWAELTFRYEESIGPKAKPWDGVAVSKAAQAFLELESPFPDTLSTVEQATFVLGYQSRWEKNPANQTTPANTDNEEVST